MLNNFKEVFEFCLKSFNNLIPKTPQTDLFQIELDVQN